jgi:hypothetical protein
VESMSNYFNDGVEGREAEDGGSSQVLISQSLDYDTGVMVYNCGIKWKRW